MILGVCAVFVRFRYARSVPPLLFWLVFRFACVLWCVAFVLRLKIKRICDDRIKLDKIYGFSFSVRFRAIYKGCLFFRSSDPSVCPSSASPSPPCPIARERAWAYITPSISVKKIFHFIWVKNGNEVLVGEKYGFIAKDIIRLVVLELNHSYRWILIIGFAKCIMRGRAREPCRKLFVEFFTILLDKTFGGVLYYWQQSSASLPTVLTTPSQRNGRTFGCARLFSLTAKIFMKIA